MAASVSVELNDNRYVVKVTPMMPLAAVAEDACRQAKVAFDKAACTLTHAKKVLDLEMPWRFANLNSGAKLDLTVKGQGGRGLGIQESASTLGTGADQAARRDLTSEAAAAGQQLQQQVLQPKQQGNAAAGATGPGSSDVKAGGSEAQAELGLEGAEKDVGRPFLLFSQEELANQADSQADTSEEFYEMTTKDYQALMSATKAKAVKDSRLMTKAMREREEAALAASLPPVRVRVVLPGQLVLEAGFKATDKVASLLDFVRKCLAPAARGGRWYLYSTPPKQVLGDPEETLYKAGLVPAAKLYLGLPDATAAMGPEELLMGQVLARKCAAAEVLNAAAQKPQLSEQSAAAAVASIPGVYTGTAAQAPAASQAGEKKVPKWLKMSK